MAIINGLNGGQIAALQNQFGENTLFSKDKISGVEIFSEQFKSPLIYILLVVGSVSLILGEYIDSSLVLLVLVVNVTMGFCQEYNAQKTLAALRGLLKPRTVVIRDGERTEIEVKSIVPGDIVVLGSGDKVPADGQLIEGNKVLVNEAILTGEEEAISKNSENANLFMGTTIFSGKGLMRVEKIGGATEVGKIGMSLEDIEEKETPLQQRLNVFTKNLVWIILSVCFLIFIIGIFHHEDLWQTLKISIILSIAAIPEALPIALTVILALGMRRILKRKGLVRKLLSIETLGSTSVICTDKTGTLTEGKMRVVRLETNDEKRSLNVLTLDNEQKSNLEIALWEYVKKVGKFDPQKIYDMYEKVDEEPFDSEKKYSMSINNIEGKKIAYLMGAPEKIVSYCQLEEQDKNAIMTKIESWADEELRLLALAYKDKGDLKDKRDFHWLGLVGIEDPIRPAVKEAIAVAQQAGIKIKIVTGDYRKTAEKAAANIGFQITPENVLEGQELENISDQELGARIENIILFTRVLPHQKLKIIKALQDKGEIVAMTGDGVNDAPALKKSDIGVAVGNATDVAKEVSDLVLLDSNFKTIVAACEEGRLILANIKKVVGYVLSNSFAEIILIFGAMILDFPSPLTVVQILWIHLICDGPPDILLGFEPKEKNLIVQTPQEIQKEKILSPTMKYLIFVISLTIGLLSLLFFWYFKERTGNIDLARTVAFATVATASLVYIFSFKNLKKSIFASENFFANKYLFYGVAYGFLLIFIAIYLPFFNHLLKTIPLQFNHWLFVFTAGFVAMFWVEIIKYVANKSKI